MRLAIVAALLLLPSTALAERAIGVTLGPNEILLEVEATGAVSNEADLVELIVQVLSRGATSAEARSANEALVQRVMAAARSAGVAAGDIQAGDGTWPTMGFIGNEAYGEGSPVLLEASAKKAMTLLRIRLRDIERLSQVRSRLEEAGASAVMGPVYSLEDDGPARRAAKAAAVRTARAEAEAHARTLDLKVARILRISERVGPSYEGATGIQDLMGAVYGLRRGPANRIETRVRVAVDFALASNAR